MLSTHSRKTLEYESVFAGNETMLFCTHQSLAPTCDKLTARVRFAPRNNRRLPIIVVTSSSRRM